MLATKEKSQPGFQLSTAALHPAFGFAISNTATSFHASVYDFRGGPRSSGYFRDAETQLDYAKARYEQPGMGRFLTVDPYMASVGPSDPGSWNRYAYTRGDPVNRKDPRGTCDQSADDSKSVTVCGDDDGGDDGGPWGGGGGGGGAGGTGGGGGGGGAHIISANPTKGQVTAINQGFQNAFNRIYNSACAEVFNPFAFLFADSDPGLLASNSSQLAFSTLNSASYYIMPLADGVGALTSTDNTVFLNANGVFFNIQTNADASATVSIPDPVTGVNRAVTFSSVQALDGFLLLHELGHETTAFATDGGPGLQAINGANSQAVLDNCFTKNAKGQYQ